MAELSKRGSIIGDAIGLETQLDEYQAFNLGVDGFESLLAHTEVKKQKDPINDQR